MNTSIIKFNYPLEGLRGLCALTVALSHVQGGQILFVGKDSYFNHFQFGHLAVLIFFVLSGYVIGINYPLASFDAKEYLVKRIVRIYPIYLLVVLFCFLIEPKLSFSDFFGQIFILQGWTKILTTNVVLWSINYEIFFYLLFLIAYKKTYGVIFQIFACILLSIVTWVYHPTPQILGGYSAGFAFWLTGLMVSRIKENNNYDAMNMDSVKHKVPVYSLLLIVFIYQHLAPGSILFNGIGLNNPYRAIVSIVDTIALPICFLLIVEIGNVKINRLLLRICYIISYGIPFVILVYLWFENRLLENEHWIVSVLAFVLAIFTLFIKQSSQILNKLSFFGGISYAIYITHYPIGYFLGNHLQANSIYSKITLLIIWFSTTIFISWLLEKKYQVSIRKGLYKVLLKSSMVFPRDKPIIKVYEKGT